MKSLVLLLGLLFASPALAQVEVMVGQPTTEAIFEPFSVDFDSQGRLHGVEFTKANRVFRLEEGEVEFIAGIKHESNPKQPFAEVVDGPDPLAAVFHGMHDIQITADDVAILADSFNHRVRRLDLKTGEVSTLAGTGERGFKGDGGPGTQAAFAITMTANLSADESALHIADIGNHRTRHLDLTTGLIQTVAGNGEKALPTTGAKALETPMGDTRAATEAKDGTLYVLLRNGNALVAVKDGRVRTVVNENGTKGYGGDGGPALKAAMKGPKYITMDPQGRVLIADAENHCIRRYDPVTEKMELIAGLPEQPSDRIGTTLLKTGLRRPHGVRIGPEGMLYICDTYNDRVLRAPYR